MGVHIWVCTHIYVKYRYTHPNGLKQTSVITAAEYKPSGRSVVS